MGVGSEGHNTGRKEHHFRSGGIYQTGALTKGSGLSVCVQKLQIVCVEG